MSELGLTKSGFVSTLTESDGVWFDRGARPKTYKAICKLSKRMPTEQMDLIPSSLMCFAPSPACHGAAGYRYSRLNETKELFVYLSPLLEGMRQSAVDNVVAHEIAHIVLGHPDSSRPFGEYYPGNVLDLEADKLIRQWGFTPAYKRSKQKTKRRR